MPFHSVFGVEKDPVQGFLVNLINLTTFSGFLFCFGYVGSMAYFQKSWAEGAWKMGKNAARILIVFYISGVAYVALVEGKIFRMDFIWEVLFLRKYPGWSDFGFVFCDTFGCNHLFSGLQEIKRMDFNFVGFHQRSILFHSLRYCS